MTAHPPIRGSVWTQWQVRRDLRFRYDPVLGAQNPRSPARGVPQKAVSPGGSKTSCVLLLGAMAQMTMMTNPGTDDVTAAVTLGSCQRFVTALQVPTIIIVSASAGDGDG